MVAKKKRLRVVLDTNVFIRSFLSRSKSSPNKRIIRLWLLEKKLQLIVTPAILEEYLEIFDEVLGFDSETIEQWRTRFEGDSRTTLVQETKIPEASRDADDNHLLAAALAGSADFLLTNDKDLLDIPQRIQDSFPFQILSPFKFLKEVES